MTEQEPVEWHHPECKGNCLACLIEEVVIKQFGTIGLVYLHKRLSIPNKPEGEVK